MKITEEQKEIINEALEGIDWYHDNISEIMESLASSPSEVMPEGSISDEHYESLAEWLDIQL